MSAVDYEEFATFAVRHFKAQRSFDEKNRVCSVRRDGRAVCFDYEERRAHVKVLGEDYKVITSEWLIDDVEAWTRALLGSGWP